MSATPDAVTGESPILVRVAEGVATITLNRPRRRNALNRALLEALGSAMRSCDEDPEIRAVVLTGAGSTFCAGLDLTDLGADAADLMAALGPAAGRQAPWDRLSKPVIGAVNGPAITGGLELVLHCDFAVAAHSAFFADTHARVGLLPGWGLSYLLPQAVGARRALEMSITSRRVPADEALAWGLVNHVVDDEELAAAAATIAREAAALPSEMTQQALALYRDVADVNLPEARELEEQRSRQWAAAAVAAGLNTRLAPRR